MSGLRVAGLLLLACLWRPGFCQNQPPAPATAPPTLKQRQAHIETMLAEVERRYGETAAAVYQLRAKAARQQQDLDDIRQSIGRLERQIDGHQKILAAQIRAAYQLGQQQKAKLLLNQQDPALSGRLLRYYQYFNQERIDKINQTARLVAELDAKNQQVQAQAGALEQTLARKQSEQEALAQMRQQRGQVLAKLGQLPPAVRMAQLLDSEAALKDLLAGLPDANIIGDDEVASPNQAEAASGGAYAVFTELKGKLRWPARGRISHKFGSPRQETVWDGVLIEAQEGTEVHAVASGKVVFADWLKGYGHLTAIDHGHGYLTLYAFTQTLLKQKNDPVRTGDVIATVGQSGGRGNPGLYFAIRKHGQALDPAPWVAKISQ